MPRKNKKQNKCQDLGKCGEIFHHNQSFTIICTSCDEKCYNFQDFADHFEEKHCERNPERKTENIPFNSFEAINIVTELSPTDIDFPDEDGVDALNPINEIKSEFEINQTLESNIDISSLNIPLKQEDAEHNSTDVKNIKNLRKSCGEDKDNNNELKKGFLCTNCGKSYKTRITLREHMAIHNNSRSFVCDFEGCGKAFISNRRLVNHKHIHTGKRNFVCEICGYRTYKNAVLTAHVRTHTGEKPFPCRICGKHFISMSMVKEHAASHATERRYRCDICNATFTRPKALYHHKPLHLAERKFSCSICEKTYAQAAGLSAHMRKHKVGGKIMLGVK